MHLAVDSSSPPEEGQVSHLQGQEQEDDDQGWNQGEGAKRKKPLKHFSDPDSHFNALFSEN